MFNYIDMLSRLTLNPDGSVDKKLYKSILSNYNIATVFKKVAVDILKIKVNQICKSESEGILFIVKFDNTDSAISAADKLSDAEIYKFSNQSFSLKVKHKDNKIKLLFTYIGEDDLEGDD